MVDRRRAPGRPVAALAERGRSSSSTGPGGRRRPDRRAALAADFYALSGHKWLLGPEGVAGLWISPAVVERARLSAPGIRSFETIDSRGHARAWPTARRFDAPNLHKPAVVGLARSAGWLSMFVGLAWAYDRGAALARATAERLAAVPGVTLVTPIDRMANLVTFRVAGWPAEAALDELGSGSRHRPHDPDLDAIRISVGWFNTADELEAHPWRSSRSRATARTRCRGATTDDPRRRSGTDGDRRRPSPVPIGPGWRSAGGSSAAPPADRSGGRVELAVAVARRRIPGLRRGPPAGCRPARW
jgi:hypothetical protein